ncbi:MAG: GlxA family transcriptional regulator [Desulfatitalea sp.]|nr:GlxA family transcriptional regulator [Desulfatitalea sp.]
MAHITLLAYPNCSPLSIFGPMEAFSIANLWCQTPGQGRHAGAPLFSWDIVSLDGEAVRGYGGVPIQPHRSIHEEVTTDFILIPAFLPPLDFIGKVSDEILAWIRCRHAENTLIGATCTGTFLLAETGLLNGKEATTNWAFARYFKKLYPNVKLKPERILCVDGGLVCSGATTSFLDLCLYLIEKFGSEDLASRCAKSLLVEAGRRSQSPYFIFDPQKNHTDDKIKEAQAHMEGKFTKTFSLDDLASDLGISPRHFKRRFKNATGDSPLAYLQRLRIEAAKHKLETTLETVNEITWQVGYEDSNSFRRLFRNFTGLSPREYRERFTRRQGQ